MVSLRLKDIPILPLIPRHPHLIYTLFFTICSVGNHYHYLKSYLMMLMKGCAVAVAGQLTCNV